MSSRVARVGLNVQRIALLRRETWYTLQRSSRRIVRVRHGF